MPSGPEPHDVKSFETAAGSGLESLLLRSLIKSSRPLLAGEAPGRKLATSTFNLHPSDHYRQRMAGPGRKLASRLLPAAGAPGRKLDTSALKSSKPLPAAAAPETTAGSGSPRLNLDISKFKASRPLPAAGAGQNLNISTL